MSKNKKVPELRFRGFTEEWSEQKLGSIAELNPKTDIPEIFEYVDLESVIGTELISHRQEYKKTAPSRAKRHAKKGDLFFQTVRPYQKNNYLYLLPNKNYVFSTGYAQLRPAVDSSFLLDLVQTDSFVNEVLARCTGTGYPAINSDELADIVIFSCLSAVEQINIGNFFKNIDTLITLYQRKYDKLCTFKKAMLEKMFPRDGADVPEIRFKGFTGKWDSKQLGEVANLLAGYPFVSRNFAKRGIPLIRGMNVKRGCLDLSTDICEFWSTSQGLEIYLLCEHDIVIQMDGALIGTSYAIIPNNVLPALLVQRVARVRSDTVDNDYIFLCIQRDFLNHIQKVKTETAVPHLSLDDICNFHVFLPLREEQGKIANFFQHLDSILFLQQGELDKLKNIKKACLEKMFVQ